MRKQKFSLEALSHILPVLDEVEQRGLVGVGNGSYSNPYTRDEYLSKVSNCTWSGGYVSGMGYVGANDNVSWNSDGSAIVGSGTESSPYSAYTFDNWSGYWSGGYVMGGDGPYYVGPDIEILGASTINSSYTNNFYRYDFVENIGARASFQSTVNTGIHNGVMSIVGSVKPSDVNSQYVFSAVANVYENGRLVESVNLDKSGTWVSSPNSIVTGAAYLNLNKYHGNVVIKVCTTGLVKTDSGYSSVGSTQEIYNQNR